VWSAVLRNWAGQPDLAITHFKTSLRLSPRDRTTFDLALGAAYFFKRQFDDAAANLLAALKRAPTFAMPYRLLASCYAHMGRLDEARGVVARLRAITSVVIDDPNYLRNPEHRELYLSGLRLAGEEQCTGLTVGSRESE
jgi:adenylate cyclase